MSDHTPPIIVAFASPKGGVGKSTSCLSIAGALAAMGQTVHVVDFDQTETLWRWYSTNAAAQQLSGLTVEQGPQSDISAFVDDVWHNRKGFVLIDLAGKLTNHMLHLAVFATLTITPAKLSEPDILEASKLSSQLKEIATRIGKPIEHRILLNEVPSILPGFQSHILSQIEQLGLQRFETLLHYRAAYPEAFLTGLPPHFADRSRPAVAKAVLELDALMTEVFGTVEQQQQKEAA